MTLPEILAQIAGPWAADAIDARQVANLAGESWPELEAKAAAENVPPGWMLFHLMFERDFLWGPGPFSRAAFDAGLATRKEPAGMLHSLMVDATRKAIGELTLKAVAQRALLRCWRG